jgi:hypothetical protein
MATAAVVGAACSDFTGVPASLPTFGDSGVVFALNGAPAGAPTALHVFSGTRLAADASFSFDVAFDLDPANQVIVLPQRAVASSLAASHTVGLQAVTTDFASIDRAPKNGYRADTALVTHAGQIVLVESQDQNACGISVTGTRIYAKIQVMAVDPATRQITIKYTVDPNCGFLSFASGVPKD